MEAKADESRAEQKCIERTGNWIEIKEEEKMDWNDSGKDNTEPDAGI